MTTVNILSCNKMNQIVLIHLWKKMIQYTRYNQNVPGKDGKESESRVQRTGRETRKYFIPRWCDPRIIQYGKERKYLQWEQSAKIHQIVKEGKYEKILFETDAQDNRFENHDTQRKDETPLYNVFFCREEERINDKKSHKPWE